MADFGGVEDDRQVPLTMDTDKEIQGLLLTASRNEWTVRETFSASESNKYNTVKRALVTSYKLNDRMP